MAARRSKPKTPSAGNTPSASPQPPDDFVLYLDENLCNSRTILDALNSVGICFERHLAHFPSGTPDESRLARWLQRLGSTHRRQTHPLQPPRKCALQQHAVREFVFASGNMSGQDMAAALTLTIPKMRRLCRSQKPPFVASITRQGRVHLRWPKNE